MENNDWLAVLQVALTALVVPLMVGGVGAYLGSRFALRQFREQKKYLIGVEAIQERIDAIRGCLYVSQRVRRGVVTGWERPGEDARETVERIEEMRDVLLSARPLFIEDDDVRRSLNLINNTLGFDRKLIEANKDGFVEQTRKAEEDLEAGVKRYEKMLAED